jgi:hypothetical protein
MKKALILILIVLCSNQLKAQEGTSLWSGISINKDLGKKFDISVNAQIRMPENISYTQVYLGELGLNYKITKGLELSGYYRFINRRKDETKEWKNRHRYYADATYSHKFGAIKFENRLRYQHQFKDNDGEIGFDSSYLRNKIELGYANKSKFTPSISADLFYLIGTGFDQLRPGLAINYKINKHNAVQVGLMQNIDLIGTENSGAIIRLGYKLKL